MDDKLKYYLHTGAKLLMCMNIEGNPVVDDFTPESYVSMINEDIGEKLLLYPMSCLRKEILVRDTLITPIIELAKLFYPTSFTKKITYVVEDEKYHTWCIVQDTYATEQFFVGYDKKNFEYTFSKKGKNVFFQTHHIIDKLIDCQIDLFGLIEADLAVDFNDFQSKYSLK